MTFTCMLIQCIRPVLIILFRFTLHRINLCLSLIRRGQIASWRFIGQQSGPWPLLSSTGLPLLTPKLPDHRSLSLKPCGLRKHRRSDDPTHGSRLWTSLQAAAAGDSAALSSEAQVLLHERAEHAIGRTAAGNHHPKLLANNLCTGATASGKTGCPT